MTPSIEGAPADAKATGDALAEKVGKDIILDEEGNGLSLAAGSKESKKQTAQGRLLKNYFAGTNSILSRIPMPAAKRCKVRREGFPFPRSSLLISV